MMRGRIVALNGVPAEQIKARRGRRLGARGRPRHHLCGRRCRRARRSSAGDWWPADYRGPPLVSFDAETRRGPGPRRSATAITVNVLGRNITATIANLREVEWQSLGINFVMVFSPNTFAGAPHTHLATVDLPQRVGAAHRGGVLRSVGPGLPDGDERAGEGRAGGGERPGRPARLAIRGACAHRAHREPVSCWRARWRPGHRARALRCRGAEDAGRDARPAARGLRSNMACSGWPRPCSACWRAALAAYFIVTKVMRLSFTLDHRGRFGAALAVSGDRRPRPDGNLANPGSEARALPEKSIDASCRCRRCNRLRRMSEA